MPWKIRVLSIEELLNAQREYRKKFSYVVPKLFYIETQQLKTSYYTRSNEISRNTRKYHVYRSINSTISCIICEKFGTEDNRYDGYIYICIQNEKEHFDTSAAPQTSALYTGNAQDFHTRLS